MASVRKLNPKDPASPWIVEYTDAAGKRRRKTPKSGLKKDADVLRQKVERELDDEVHTPRRDSLSVEALGEAYIKHLEDRNRDGRLGYGTFRRIATVIRRHVIPPIAAIKVCDLTDAHSIVLQKTMLRAGLTARYTRDVIRQLLCMEKFALRRGYTKKTSAHIVIEDMRGIPAAPIAKPTKEDVLAILRTAAARKVKGGTIRGKARLECFINIAAFCGLRVGEIIALKIEHVDFDARLIRVRHSMTEWGEFKGPKTKAGVRDVPMPAHVRVLLREYIDHHHISNRHGIVFWCQEPWAGDKMKGPRLHMRTNPIRPLVDYSAHQGIVRRADIGRRWHRLQGRAGIETPFHFHALRHFCAANWIENGMPLPDVAKLLGHAKVDVTLEIYAYALREESRQHEAIERIAASMVPALLPAPDATRMRLPALTH